MRRKFNSNSSYFPNIKVLTKTKIRFDERKDLLKANNQDDAMNSIMDGFDKSTIADIGKLIEVPRNEITLRDAYKKIKILYEKSLSPEDYKIYLLEEAREISEKYKGLKNG